MHAVSKWMMALSAVVVALPAAAQIRPAEASGLTLGADTDYALLDLGNTNLGWKSGPLAGNVLLGHGLTANLFGRNNGGLSDSGLRVVSDRRPGVQHHQVTAAPRVDPASAASGLTLLVGILVVLRGPR